MHLLRLIIRVAASIALMLIAGTAFFYFELVLIAFADAVTVISVSIQPSDVFNVVSSSPPAFAAMIIIAIGFSFIAADLAWPYTRLITRAGLSRKLLRIPPVSKPQFPNRTTSLRT